MYKNFVFTILYLYLFLDVVSSLYFYIKETEKKCFSEDLAEETLVVGRYKTEIYSKEDKKFVMAGPKLGMHVEIADPKEKLILSRTYATEGKFTFSSHSSGEHQICLYSNSTAWFGGGDLKVHLSIRVGEEATDYKEIQNREKYTELQMRMLQLKEQVEQINKEQAYQRLREENFRQLSESTSQHVLWWSISQTALFMLICVWQLQHLRKFFETKKLV